MELLISKWLKRNTDSLAGKTVAVTGSTGGLGKALCKQLCALGADLILLDRNAARSSIHKQELLSRSPNATVRCIALDLANMASVKAATEQLAHIGVDVFIHNAGAYAIPRHKCDTGYDNVFQINFAAPYYMIRSLLPMLRARGGHVVAVGSIAHRYSKTDVKDVDFSTRRRASLVYGNAKRYLTYALQALFAGENTATLCIAHPGISQTGITAHYPKPLYALIKYPMRVIFPRPKRACLSILKGVFTPCKAGEWIGPRIFDVWGSPRKKPLCTASAAEIARIAQIAEEIYRKTKF
jgi:NAD(P)-dependent dehydrogenase (short-subunit alcohol dehydrogenase family)